MNEQEHALNEEGRDLWNRKAVFWDQLHGDEGNMFHRVLVSPSVERLLDLQAGETVLDVACGNGTLARRLARLGGRVYATDFSAQLIERAQARVQTDGEAIQYQVVDATDEMALRALGEGQFDALTCTMGIMDIPVVAPLFRAASHLLKPHGRFVIATAHPSFNSNNPAFVTERTDEDGVLTLQHFVKIRDYLFIPPIKGAGAPNEPNPHYYYHRPLHELIRAAVEAGLVLDGMEEPAFPRPEGDSTPYWRTELWQIPVVMTLRLRKA